MTVSLPSDLETYINDKIAAGMYPSASEVIRASFRLMQEQDELNRIRLDALRAELAKGEADIERGDYTTISSKEELEAFFDNIKAEGRRRLAEKQKEIAA